MIYRCESCRPGVTALQVGAHLREIGQLSEQGAKTTDPDGLSASPQLQEGKIHLWAVIWFSWSQANSLIPRFLGAGRKQTDLRDTQLVLPQPG